MIGGPFDSRPPEEWRVEDGLTYWPSVGRRRQLQCTARVKRTIGTHPKDKRDPRQVRCCGQPRPTKTKCRFHGAASPGGPIKNARYSIRVGPIARAYERMLQRQDLIALEPTLALMDVVVEETANMAADNDSAEYRKDLLELWRIADEHGKAKRLEQFVEVFKILGEKIKSGADRASCMQRLFEFSEKRTQRSERAQELGLKSRDTVTKEELAATFVLLTDTIVKVYGSDATKGLDAISVALRSRVGFGLELGRERWGQG